MLNEPLSRKHFAFKLIRLCALEKEVSQFGVLDPELPSKLFRMIGGEESEETQQLAILALSALIGTIDEAGAALLKEDETLVFFQTLLTPDWLHLPQSSVASDPEKWLLAEAMRSRQEEEATNPNKHTPTRDSAAISTSVQCALLALLGSILEVEPCREVLTSYRLLELLQCLIVSDENATVGSVAAETLEDEEQLETENDADPPFEFKRTALYVQRALAAINVLFKYDFTPTHIDTIAYIASLAPKLDWMENTAAVDLAIFVCRGFQKVTLKERSQLYNLPLLASLKRMSKHATSQKEREALVAAFMC